MHSVAPSTGAALQSHRCCVLVAHPGIAATQLQHATVAPTGIIAGDAGHHRRAFADLASLHFGQLGRIIAFLPACEITHEPALWKNQHLGDGEMEEPER